MSFQLRSQMLPKENSILNYRIIGFSFPAQKANKYKIEIATGKYYSIDSFKKNIIYSAYSKNKKIIAEVPAFGKQYTWRIVANNSQEPNVKNDELHHFQVLEIPEVDTAVTHLRIIQKALKYKDAYVFLDGNRAMYDMNGQPVWFLPDIDGYKTDISKLRDMKITSRGTITFIYEELGAYEINYNGDILWKAPNSGEVSGSSTENYHHEFTRLKNGHYMILGLEAELWNKHMVDPNDSSFLIIHTDRNKHDSSKIGYTTLPFGTIIEYDQKGNVVWSWKSSDYFRRSDIYYHIEHTQPELAAHENSFYFDDQANVIYVSFRNISRILKIKYPEGIILDTYGEIFKPGIKVQGNGLFCGQHSVSKSDDDNLYLFNNNSCSHGSIMPQILKLKEPDSPGGQLEKIWEYDCIFDGVDLDKYMHDKFIIGGNVTELPDNSLFVNMSTRYSKVFILSADKKILWSAIPEKWSPEFKRWDMVYQYRASMITGRTELENLVWGPETKD